MRNHKRIARAFIIIILGIVFSSTGFADSSQDFIPGEDGGFYYTIKKGDTLWDLSQKFYNSQWDWPGLWEMNDEIKNPHKIYPGKKIQIFLKGNNSKTPIIVGVKNKDAGKLNAFFSFGKIGFSGFLRETQHPSFGTIIKEQDGNLMMSNNDIVYIKPRGSEGKEKLVPGSIHHIFTTSPVEETINNQPFKSLKHLIKAEVKILEQKTEYITGIITKSHRPVNKGDLIMEYQARDVTIRVKEKSAPIDARIICSEDNNLMINDYRVAFINIGKYDIHPGEIYSIMRTNEIKEASPWYKKKKEPLKLENLISGKLIVLHTQDTTATVMVLSSGYPIHPDDIVN